MMKPSILQAAIHLNGLANQFGGQGKIEVRIPAAMWPDFRAQARLELGVDAASWDRDEADTSWLQIYGVHFSEAR